MTNIALATAPLIGGRRAALSARPALDVIDPTTGSLITQIERATIEDAEAAAQAAVAAFEHGPWPTLSFARRAEAIERLTHALAARSDQIADAYVRDQGGLISFAPYQFAVVKDILDDVVRLGREFDDEEWRGDVLVRRVPMGPVLASVPWNAPIILAIVKLAPALLAGCPVIVKSDPLAPLAALVLAEALEEAEFPEGVVSLLIGGGDIGRHLVAHAGIANVSFTGSTSVGREVGKSAMDHFARTTLELGGKGAAIVLDDMDPADAAQLIWGSCLIQSGQVCTTSSRILVPADRYAEWVDALGELFDGFTVGDPADAATQIGPLISEGQLESVDRYVRTARAEGARIVTGGAPLDRPGYFYPPTLVADATSDMEIVTEEVFGPVIVVLPYADEDDAVRITNDTHYGLANAVFTNTPSRALALGRRLRSGTVSINAFGSAMTQPFGGFGASGQGREGGPEGIEEFLEVQQIIGAKKP